MKNILGFVVTLALSINVFSETEKRYPNVQKIEVKSYQVCDDYFGIKIYRNSAKGQRMENGFCNVFENKKLIATFDMTDFSLQPEYGVWMPEKNIYFDNFCCGKGRSQSQENRDYIDDAYQSKKSEMVINFYKKIWGYVNAKQSFVMYIDGSSKTLVDVELLK